LTGSQGPIGLTGPQGSIGLTGAAGAAGAAGTAGLDGKTVLSGAGDPVASSAAGVVGDFYVDTVGNKIYGPKTGADWTGIVGVSLVGPQGPAGPQGAPGSGSGTVTNVATGAGLSGGPISTTGTISIASGGVTNAMLANPALTVNAGSGLSGGGSLALGGSTTLSLASPVSVANGGTGAADAATARSNFGLVIGTNVLAPNGSAANLTNFPTFNQNTTGTAANVTGTVAIANGGTGATTAASARTNLGIMIYKTTANWSNNTTTPTAITGLGWPVAANTQYAFTCILSGVNSTAGSALRLNITGPASPTIIAFKTRVPNAAASETMGTFSAFSANAQTISDTNGVLTTPFIITIDGVLQNGVNAGTVQINGSGSAAQSSTIYSGSYCQVF
jgi:hypothetical protein